MGIYQSSDGSTFANQSVEVKALPSGARFQNLLVRRSGSDEWRIEGQLSNDAAVNHTIDDLIPGETYEIAAQAFDGFGNPSSLSAINSFTADGDTTAPGAPSGVNLDDKTGRAVFLDWAENSEIDLKKYEIQRDTSNTFPSPTVVGRPQTDKFTDTNFSTSDFGTTFYYRIRAIDHSSNKSSWSSTANVNLTKIGTGEADDTTPSDPSAASLNGSSFYVASDGTVKAWLDIDVPAVPSDAKYQLLYFRNSSGNNDWQTAQRLQNSSQFTVRIDELVPGENYDIATQSFTRFAEESSNIVTATSSPFTADAKSTAPNAPAGASVNLTNTGNWAVISWDINSENDIGHYEIFRHTSDSFANATKIAESKITWEQDMDIDPVTEYHYWITAVDTSGNISNQTKAGVVHTAMFTNISLLESFEGGIATYGGDTTKFSVTTNQSKEEDESLVYTNPDGAYEGMADTNVTVTAGTVFEVWVRLINSDAQIGFWFGMSSEVAPIGNSPGGYAVALDGANNQIDILKQDSISGFVDMTGSLGSDFAPSTGTWYLLWIRWNANGVIEVKVFDTSGNSQGFKSGEDTAHDEGGIGFIGNAPQSSVDEGYIDFVRKKEPI